MSSDDGWTSALEWVAERLSAWMSLLLLESRSAWRSQLGLGWELAFHGFVADPE